MLLHHTDFDYCISEKTDEIRRWAQGIHERAVRLEFESLTDEVSLPEGLVITRLEYSSSKNFKIELRGSGEDRSSLRIEGEESIDQSGSFWWKRSNRSFNPAEIALSLPADSEEKELGITEKVVVIRFGSFHSEDTLDHLSIRRYYESPSLVTQEILEKQELGRKKMMFYKNHKASISVRFGEGNAGDEAKITESESPSTGFVAGEVRLEADSYYSLTEWPSLAKRNVTINSTSTLRSGQNPELGLETKPISHGSIASATQVFQAGIDSSAEACTKIQELCDSSPDTIDLKEWLSDIVSFVTTTELSITGGALSAEPRVNLVVGTVQGVLA